MGRPFITMIRITVEDFNPDGSVDETHTLQGNYEYLGELFKAYKRMSLAMGYSPENVEEYFRDCENWDDTTFRKEKEGRSLKPGEAWKNLINAKETIK